MLNKLKFLFTNRLTVWRVQECCHTDMIDCPDCGTGLFHGSSDHLSLADAIKAAVEDLEMCNGEGNAVVIQHEDEWHVEIDNFPMGLKIYQVTITL